MTRSTAADAGTEADATTIIPKIVYALDK
jgi:hypothetical protein